MHVPTTDDLLNDRRPRRLRLGAIAAALALTFGLAACGDQDEDTTTTTDAPEQTTTTEETTTTEAGGAATGETVEITGVNYAFEGVPETAEVGTELSFTNASEDEVHEMVVVRIDDDETRPLEELLGLGDEEAGEVVQDVGVAVAMPGEDGMVVDGELVLEEPGRYALLCFIPVGADPQVLQELMANPPADGEAPDMGEGPPHVTQGMAAELTVE